MFKVTLIIDDGSDNPVETRAFNSDEGFGSANDRYNALKAAKYYLDAEYSEAVDAVQPAVDKGRGA